VSLPELSESLARHACKNARHQLFPKDAARVYRLLANKQVESAVELYFASVGGRGDQEKLIKTSIVF